MPPTRHNTTPARPLGTICTFGPGCVRHTGLANRVLLLLAIVCFAAAACPVVQGQKGNAAEQAGGFVRVPSPITSGVYGTVKRECETLLKDGARVIVFEIQPGKSKYGACLDLAQYIESITGAKTVAYVSQPLTGHAVMVALAADELVMAERAAIG